MTEKKDISSHLSEEAGYFYKKIFSAPAPRQTIEKYIAVNLNKIPHAHRGIRELVLKKADIEAIEMAWRFKSPRNVLTKKIHILLYLAETTPENFPVFINTKNKRFFSFIVLAYHLIRSIGKFLKGIFLLKRHRLV
jgi:hypothetical protein